MCTLVLILVLRVSAVRHIQVLYTYLLAKTATLCCSVFILLGKNPLIFTRQRLGRNVAAVTHTYATIEELLDSSFSMWLVSYQRKQVISSSQNFLLEYQMIDSGQGTSNTKKNFPRRESNSYSPICPLAQLHVDYALCSWTLVQNIWDICDVSSIASRYVTSVNSPHSTCWIGLIEFNNTAKAI
jgi:hypothetical protein